MRLSLVDITIDKFLPQTVGWPILAAAQVLHDIADGVLTVAHADIVDIRILDSLFLRQHGLVTTNYDRQIRHQFFDLFEIRFHRIPVRTHDRESNHIRIHRLYRLGIVFRRILLGVSKNQDRFQ